MFAFTPDRIRHLAWLPAAMLIAWGILAAAGLPLTPDSRAATSGGNGSVSATVLPEIHTTGSTCPGASLTGTSFGAANDDQLLGSCTMVFGTTNGAGGAQLRVESPRPAANAAFCQEAVATNACSGGSFTDVAYTGAASLVDGAFGIEAQTVANCTTPTWTAGNFYGLRPAATAPGNGDLMCDKTAGGSDASYTLRFYADPSNSQVSGMYYARADFTAEAN